MIVSWPISFFFFAKLMLWSCWLLHHSPRPALRAAREEASRLEEVLYIPRQDIMIALSSSSTVCCTCGLSGQARLGPVVLRLARS